MQFTPQELKLIERLKKHEPRWRYVRLLRLVSLVLLAVLCGMFGYILHLAIPTTTQDRAGTEWAIAFIAALGGIHLFMLIFTVAILCTQWRGDARNKLLLKLLNESALAK